MDNSNEAIINIETKKNTQQSLPFNFLGHWEWTPKSNELFICNNYKSAINLSTSSNISINDYLEYIGDDDRQAFKDLINESINTGHHTSHIHYITRPDGKTIKVQEFLIPIKEEPTRIRSTVLEITLCAPPNYFKSQSPDNKQVSHCYAETIEKELIELRAKNENEAKERIQAEKSLWESQRKFKTLLSNLPGVAYRCSFDSDRNMEFLSKGSHALTGYHSWDLISNPIKTFASLVHPDDLESSWQEIKQACDKSQPYKISYRITRSDNEERWVQDQGQAIHSTDTHEIVALEGFIIDITDSKQAQESQQRINEELEQRVEERTHALKLAVERLENEITERHRIEDQLRVNEASLRNAQRIANLGSWDKNITSQSHSYSDEIFRMLNIDPGNTMLHEDIWTPHIHPDDIERVLAERENALTNNTSVSIEYKIVLDNNEEHFIHERAETTTNEENEHTTISTTVLDITESKRIQDELIKYREHLHELVDLQTRDLIEARDAALAAERAMSSFIANMSHEIRTPLHGILSFSNFGLKKIETADRKKLGGYFEEINESGQTLLLLLNDLLDLSKLKAGKMMYDYIHADIIEIIKLAAKESAAMRTEKNITLNINSPEKLTTDFDKDKFRQVIRNLLSNAIKFSPEGAIIDVNVETPDDKQIDITVIDQGPGIPESELSDIFSPFIQSSKTRTKAGGTGLGLAICKEIIESGHNGAIKAENNSDCGATFTLQLPIKYSK